VILDAQCSIIIIILVEFAKFCIVRITAIYQKFAQSATGYLCPSILQPHINLRALQHQHPSTFDSKCGTEPSSSNVQQQAKSDQHRSLKGYEVCVHTCVDPMCSSMKTGTILWNREGHSCRKHACLASVHPECNTDCPEIDFLATQAMLMLQAPTDMECYFTPIYCVQTHPSLINSDQDISRKDIWMISGSPPNSANTKRFDSRTMDIIFIPDPTLELNNKSKALCDLHLCQTTFQIRNSMAVKHLDGSVHCLVCSLALPSLA